MNENNDIELFYIYPYTISYNSGGRYYNDETCSFGYRSPSESVWYGNPTFFESKEELLNWIIRNNGKPIPTIYRIKYISNCFGVDDVIKITNLNDGKTELYTIVRKIEYSTFTYAIYDEKKSEDYKVNVWEYIFGGDSKSKIQLEAIYKEFVKRGIKLNFDITEKSLDRREIFDFVGDPLVKRKEFQGKKLILHYPTPW